VSPDPDTRSATSSTGIVEASLTGDREDPTVAYPPDGVLDGEPD
jgi:hypothetical protein